MIFGQFNKSQNIKIYYAAKQILHKSALYIYLDQIETLINNSLFKELDNIRQLYEDDINPPNPLEIVIKIKFI